MVSIHSICNINKLETIQRRTARFVLNDYSSVTAMLSRLSWHPLQIRRSSLKLTMFYKIINQLVNIRVTYLKETSHCSRKHSHCYQQKQARIEAFANSFSPSAIKLWSYITAVALPISPEVEKTSRVKLPCSTSHTLSS